MKRRFLAWQRQKQSLALLVGWTQLAALLVGAVSEFLHWLHSLMYKARRETKRLLGLL